MKDLDLIIAELVIQLENEVRNKRSITELIPDTPIISKADLRGKTIDNCIKTISTSGSTGEPLLIQKNLDQYIWYKATNIRELLWRKWDTSKNLAVITPLIDKPLVTNWNINNYIFPNKNGKQFIHPVEGDLQKFIDSVDCEYLFTYPSIASILDVSKFEDIKTSNEQGGSNYSCTEAGTIALECPDNPDVYHVMENIIVEIDDEKNIIITDLLHPLIKRYKLGDVGEFGECHCGRQLQTLKKNVVGRIRNMACNLDGTRYWPRFGTTKFAEQVPHLERYQAIQTSLTNIDLLIQGSLINEKDIVTLQSIVKQCMGEYFTVNVLRVNGFPSGKFEEFICKL